MNGNLIQLKHAGCRTAMQDMDAASVDSIVTDPPYGLSFMGKEWDHGVPGQVFWDAALRVAKPGAHLLAFGGTRTYHRLVCAIEDAGWEIRDTIAWVYGSGFPKSLDVSKAIDKAAGAEREVVGKRKQPLGKNATFRRSAQASQGYRPEGKEFGQASLDEIDITAPATPEAEQWDGWGTALKPALEPICVARKPFSRTVAENVLEHGTGALNVDGCRVAHGDEVNIGAMQYCQTRQNGHTVTLNNPGFSTATYKPGGRWPANLIHDGSDEVVQDMGDAARFFYCAKASKADRGSFNDHPTVKPTDLMRYLCRLVTPPGGART